MSAQWHSLVSQKIFLASRLAGLCREQDVAMDREACLQGAIELALQARQLMLTLVARYHQQKQATPESLDALLAVIPGTPDADMLTELAQAPDSWWNHLEQLGAFHSQPPKQQKSVSDDNIIAVSVASGPDRSVEGLLESLAAMKSFVTELGERHAEW